MRQFAVVLSSPSHIYSAGDTAHHFRIEAVTVEKSSLSTKTVMSRFSCGLAMPKTGRSSVASKATASVVKRVANLCCCRSEDVRWLAEPGYPVAG